MGNHSSETILVAVTVLKSLDIVCEYAIPLAKRTGKSAMIHVLLVHENEEDLPDPAEEEERFLQISRHGKEAEIAIRNKVVNGYFPKKVAECLFELDCPLLVVGDGDDREKRLRELKEIESILVANKAWHHRKGHHFLVVSEKRKDPVLVIQPKTKKSREE